MLLEGNWLDIRWSSLHGFDNLCVQLDFELAEAFKMASCIALGKDEQCGSETNSRCNLNNFGNDTFGDGWMETKELNFAMGKFI